MLNKIVKLENTTLLLLNGDRVVIHYNHQDICNISVHHYKDESLVIEHHNFDNQYEFVSAYVDIKPEQLKAFMQIHHDLHGNILGYIDYETGNYCLSIMKSFDSFLNAHNINKVNLLILKRVENI